MDFCSIDMGELLDVSSNAMTGLCHQSQIVAIVSLFALFLLGAFVGECRINRHGSSFFVIGSPLQACNAV